MYISVVRLSSLTAIEFFTSCGKLEPLSAAAAAEAKRVDTQLMRGARNAMYARFDDIRNAIVKVKKLENEEAVYSGRCDSAK
jgi:hypothetical protein